MKKLMLAVLAGLMVFATTASIAAAEVTVGGELEMRYDLWYNLDLDKNSLAYNNDEEYKKVNTQHFFADRILLNVDAKITEGLEAFVELDSSNWESGNQNGGDTDERVWGANHSQEGFVSAVNYQGEHLAIRQAWINFMIPGIPVGVKIGHQPLALGHGISLNTSRMGTDAILVYSKPIPDLLVAGVYAKVVAGSDGRPGTDSDGVEWYEGTPFENDELTGNEHRDADVWAALANYTFMPGNTVGVNYLFVHDGSTGASFADDSAIHLHNIGVTADGVIGPITYKAEYDYQDINMDYLGKDRGKNVSHAFMVGAGAKVAMINVGMEMAYGTGTSFNKYRSTNTISDLDYALSHISRTYLSPYGETSYNYAFLYNDKIGQMSSHGGGGGFGFGDGTGGFGLANTGYVKLSVGATPIDKLNLGVDVLYLRASNAVVNMADHLSGKSQTKDLGWEIDAHADYKIYDNLNLNVTGGVFLPGGYYRDLRNWETYGDDNTADLAYGLETKLTCKF